MAIVGPSGSGKSTLAMLVPRFYDPDEGAVLVDGHDVRQRHARARCAARWAWSSRRASSSPTRSERTSPTGGPDASDEEIEAAARAAQAHEFILELPRGYDTVVGERGLTLSGGQRQRIALARAILYDPAS